MDAGMFFELFDEREIASVVGFLEDMLEIAARLMSMNQQGEMETLGHGDSFFLPDHDNKPGEFMGSSHCDCEPSARLGRMRHARRNGWKKRHALACRLNLGRMPRAGPATTSLVLHTNRS